MRFHSPWNCAKLKYRNEKKLVTETTKLGKTAQTWLNMANRFFSRMDIEVHCKSVTQTHLHVSGREVQGHVTSSLQLKMVRDVGDGMFFYF